MLVPPSVVRRNWPVVLAVCAALAVFSFSWASYFTDLSQPRTEAEFVSLDNQWGAKPFMALLPFMLASYGTLALSVGVGVWVFTTRHAKSPEHGRSPVPESHSAVPPSREPSPVRA